MYRRTRKAAEARERRIRAMLAGKAAARLARPAPDYPADLPELRMRITVERLDFGHETHVVELHRTRRVDVYAVTIDGLHEHADTTREPSQIPEGLEAHCGRDSRASRPAVRGLACLPGLPRAERRAAPGDWLQSGADGGAPGPHAGELRACEPEGDVPTLPPDV